MVGNSAFAAFVNRRACAHSDSSPLARPPRNMVPSAIEPEFDKLSPLSSPSSLPFIDDLSSAKPDGNNLLGFSRSAASAAQVLARSSFPPPKDLPPEDERAARGCGTANAIENDLASTTSVDSADPTMANRVYEVVHSDPVEGSLDITLVDSATEGSSEGVMCTTMCDESTIAYGRIFASIVGGIPAEEQQGKTHCDRSREEETLPLPHLRQNFWKEKCAHRAHTDGSRKAAPFLVYGLRAELWRQVPHEQARPDCSRASPTAPVPSLLKYFWRAFGFAKARAHNAWYNPFVNIVLVRMIINGATQHKEWALRVL
eukprot:CAMPEP_0198325026 /NCGR_PEP_ID=MMETSP1450-20131203/12877_1 /TAXON_ID=753684 ORGANISM="Madagascaria erythrocladiodes, Strain CCMP3234" /NCGR_SAMPLE_ID=MMETSP1450 /ASSEMBLY_ACC=CAM_ASM_001115 /LENGTH=314 /DNA_ID=CAMNT_0044028869 /DNA_START=917 /DNA_END=1863 /DNA_ORIENTATION=+